MFSPFSLIASPEKKTINIILVGKRGGFSFTIVRGIPSMSMRRVHFLIMKPKGKNNEKVSF